MPVFFLCGLALLCLAFVATAYEAVSPDRAGSLFLSAGELWRSFSPAGMDGFRGHVEALFGALAWDPVMTTMLRLPAWVLIGVPGGVLTWIGRPHREPVDEDFDEGDLFLFDRLARAAKDEDGIDAADDDMAPRHDVFDPESVPPPPTAEEYRKVVGAPERKLPAPTDPPPPREPDRGGDPS